MKSSHRLVIVTVALLIGSGAFSTADGCYICKYSPHGWGFCRTGYDRGHGDCTEYVEDPFSGRTDCEITSWGTCGPGLGGGGGCAEGTTCDPFYLASMPCSWTDLPAEALV